ncbi:uncharacterized protein [Henckelia pumila]|uniref:uncharacterized protein n=1 Tax=Henckelia pumila TaxID=405737 RepID=UPI003C6E3FC1
MRAVKIELPESFQVGAIIAKLPSTWKSYWKKILHSSKDFSLKQIQNHLRIEEESMTNDKNENSGEGTSKANVINQPIKVNYNIKKKGNPLDPKIPSRNSRESPREHALFVENLGIMLEITYQEIEDGQEIQMGNEGCSKVFGKGSAILTFTSEKTITLTNVRKAKIKVVYDYGKLTISISNNFVGK